MNGVFGMTRKPFYYTSKTNYLILFDFDETYYPHERTKEQLQSVYQLEQYLQSLAAEKHVKIGWVTGSSLEHVINKMDLANMMYYPHFIGSNLGTQLIEVSENGEFLPVQKWNQQIDLSSFSSSAVYDLIQECQSQYNIKLVEQTQFGQTNIKYNYYYFHESTTKTAYDLNIIRHLAKRSSIGININRCNPKAGDPENAYDIDFIPFGSGKKAVANFMMDYYKVSFENTIAFGDSGNDIDMLKGVKHGYLVHNATEEAKGLHDNIAQFSYADGILDVCKGILGNHSI
jgi:kanosamine-6-phosphate phosphatase